VNTEIHQLDITKYIVDFGFRATVWTEYGGSPASGRTSSYHMSSRIAHLSTYLSGRRAFFQRALLHRSGGRPQAFAGYAPLSVGLTIRPATSDPMASGELPGPGSWKALPRSLAAPCATRRPRPVPGRLLHAGPGARRDHRLSSKDPPIP
jgi:hypothetical protein